jgi:hypothetical protein
MSAFSGFLTCFGLEPTSVSEFSSFTFHPPFRLALDLQLQFPHPYWGYSTLPAVEDLVEDFPWAIEARETEKETLLHHREWRIGKMVNTGH